MTVHALKQITPPKLDERGAAAVTYCGLEGTLYEWSSDTGSYLHGQDCEVVSPYVPQEIVSQGRVVGQTSQYNDKVTCSHCKDLIRCG